jgi:hypothetical protein
VSSAFLACRWRVGRSIGRTIYAITGPLEGDADHPIGMLDTRELAAEAVRAHNASIDSDSRAGRRLLTGGDEAEHAARSKVPGQTVTAIHHEVDGDGERLTLEFAHGSLSVRACHQTPGTLVASWTEV